MSANHLLLARAAVCITAQAADTPDVFPAQPSVSERMGNARKALEICGNRSCEEYAELAKSIADYKAKN